LDTNSQPLEFIRHAVACLDDTHLALLDFDILRDHLTSLVDHLDQSEQASSQHALLRSDYEQRIAGMIKAIAAVDRKRGSVEDALARIDRLTTLTTSELIAEYRRVSAAFRDSFPTTFHPLPPSPYGPVPHPLAGGIHAPGPPAGCNATLSERRHPEPVEGPSRAPRRAGPSSNPPLAPSPTPARTSGATLSERRHPEPASP
jgi:hypothetical protein